MCSPIIADLRKAVPRVCAADVIDQTAAAVTTIKC